ncbi:MAG TPA: response regulator [Methylomirabilota bacterium]|nr:response regulator [Methylomirabilota bacterium]
MPAKVLVADDEPNIALSLEFLMQQAGFGVRIAADGEAALAAMAEEQPDLVVLDVMLPKRDGYEVCRAIRADPRWAGVRVLMLTAKGRDSERETGLALGADAYITKPFSNRDVVERVKQLLAAPRATTA